MRSWRAASAGLPTFCNASAKTEKHNKNNSLHIYQGAMLFSV
jgi:hypothetical protein